MTSFIMGLCVGCAITLLMAWIFKSPDRVMYEDTERENQRLFMINCDLHDQLRKKS